MVYLTKETMKILNFLISLYLLSPIILDARSIHRPFDQSQGYIKVKGENSDKDYFLFDSHLREISLFRTYDNEDFNKNLAPETLTYSKDDQQTEIQINVLNELIENLIKEINNQKTKFTDFDVLKQRDFNKFTKTGNIILKFKNYPFIFKLFLETPESLANPFAKAFQARGIFNLGGSFRHLMGFTRIKNLELIKEKIENHPHWSELIEFPRKWFWLPEDPKWIEITGYNLGNQSEQYIKIPGVYGLICDQMMGSDKDPEIKNYFDDYLKLCTYLNYTLDAHPNNFLLSKDKKMLLIDTEHFAILTGMQNKIKVVDNYTSWYINVAKKYIKEKFLSSKEYRRLRQANNKTEFNLYN